MENQIIKFLIKSYHLHNQYLQHNYLHSLILLDVQKNLLLNQKAL